MGHFVFDLSIEFPMPSLEGGHVAFSRHHNSFQQFRAILIVTNYFPFVDLNAEHSFPSVEKLVQILAQSVNSL